MWYWAFVIYLLVICVSSFEECLFDSFARFKNLVVWVPYIFWILAPYQMYDLQIHCKLPLYTANCFLCCAEKFSFGVILLVCFAFVPCVFKFAFKKLSPRLMSWVFFQIFSSQSFTISCLIRKSLSILKSSKISPASLFCMWIFRSLHMVY
jgi:hypothetical protein